MGSMEAWNRMPNNQDDTLKRIRRTLHVFIIFGILLVIIVASICWVALSFSVSSGNADATNLSAILFGSAQVALFAITIVIGFLTFFGIGYIERKIQEAVKTETTQRLGSLEAETAKRLEGLEREVRGRSLGILGYVIGENSLTKDFTVIDPERLREGFQYSEQAYALLRGSGIPVEFTVLNNYLYYACLLGDKSRRKYLLECAHRLRSAADEHDSPNLLLTYSRTILVFSQDDKEIAEACSIVEDLKSGPRLNDKQKREANHLASQCETRSQGTNHPGNKTATS
jgi:hypothetical protein